MKTANGALLERSPFFQAAGSAAMNDLLRISFTHLLPKGTVLFEQGDEPEFLHILLAGSIGLQAHGEGGEPTLVEIFGAGEVFLAPAVMLNLPYLASATALTEVRVLMVPAEAFREAYGRSLPLCRATAELLARHWRLMVDQVVDLKVHDAETRVTRFLERRASKEAGAAGPHLPEPRIAIAARLGMTPETLSRTLTALEKKGKLSRGPAVAGGRRAEG